jgi:hypothetical protein
VIVGHGLPVLSVCQKAHHVYPLRWISVHENDFLIFDFTANSTEYDQKRNPSVDFTEVDMVCYNGTSINMKPSQRGLL